MGLVDVPPSHRRELDQANLLVERTATLLRTARDAGAEYILEHPADRGLFRRPCTYTSGTGRSGLYLSSQTYALVILARTSLSLNVRWEHQYRSTPPSCARL
eukprot:4474770-Pleurochrysis_carterae.AAC.2